MDNIPDISDLVTFLQEYNVKIFNENEDVYDIISKFLENNENDNAFFIVDFGKIIRQYQRWVQNLPRIKPYYAVKCNPNTAVIKLLDRLDVGFDCASRNEISQILSQNISPDRIIFANPCKGSGQIKYARSQDIDILVFDDLNELFKIKLYHPHANLVIRIITDDSKSECKFSCKFGISFDDINEALLTAKSLKLNVVGVSFHVGSNCHSSDTYYNSIKDAKKVFELATNFGFNFNLLDIGGGFPGFNQEGKITFEEISVKINNALDDFFPITEFSNDNLKIISEPGRYFVSASHTLVLNIIGKKEKIIDNDKFFTYYLNDGVYGSFNCIFFDHAKPKITPYNERDGKLYKSTIFGPTCDSMDTISKTCMLPDLAIGEWVYVENFGAYTTAAASTFNGFQHTPCYYIISYK
jgi:ornithine decarboxylase